MKPLLIIISGPPCAGKTTLAKLLRERFALPVMGKDTLKEPLFDTLGWQDRERSRAFGRASIALLCQFVATQLTARRSCIVESNFQADLDGPRFLALRERHAFVTRKLGQRLAAYFLRIASHATGRGALTPVRGGGLRASSVNHQARSAPHPSPGGIASCT